MSSGSFMDGITPFALNEFEEAGYSDEDVLALAEGLLLDAIPCLNSVYPNFTESQKTTIKFAVLEMAKYIKIDYFNFERATSPFQSETIGSYSYSKMAANIKKREDTGVPGFDRAVAQFAGLCSIDSEGGGASTTSEQVFKPGYGEFIERREGVVAGPAILHDPRFYPWGRY